MNRRRAVLFEGYTRVSDAIILRDIISQFSATFVRCSYIARLYLLDIPMRMRVYYKYTAEHAIWAHACARVSCNHSPPFVFRARTYKILG